MNKSLLVRSAIALALATPLLASAESDLTVGTGNAVARLDFRIIVPRVLYFAVGTGNAAVSDNNTVDDVTFDYTTNAGAVGQGTGSPAAVITGAAVTVRAIGNNGVITVTSTNAGALTNATTDTIPWSQITVLSSDNTNFPSPAPSGAATTLALSSGTKVTNRTATWTYSYTNSNVVPPGTYGSIDGTQNGRLTYTASMP
jgi:hypothetical protein